MKENRALFDDVDGIYNYCPSIIEHKNKRHYFYCSNLLPYKIIDYIAYKEITINRSNQIKFHPKTYILAPNSENQLGWDHVHACDPSLIGGEFYVNSVKYNYCMAYLGCNTLDCTINEVGLAFANQLIGPWYKYDYNPYIHFNLENEGRYWGVGQPSIVSLDKKGKFRLFYTKGDRYGSHTHFVDCDFSLNGNGSCALSKQISEIGINEDLVNGDFMYDEDMDGYFCTRDPRYREKTFPNFIATYVQVCFAKTALIENGVGEWKIIKKITENETGFKRNHNAGLVRDLYGWKIKNKEIEVIYTTSTLASSNEDLKYLWSYRLHSYIIKEKM